MSGESETYVRPGIIRFGAYAVIYRSHWLGQWLGSKLLEVEARVEPGKSYKLVGQYNGSVLECWLEESLNGTKAGATSSIEISFTRAR